MTGTENHSVAEARQDSGSRASLEERAAELSARALTVAEEFKIPAVVAAFIARLERRVDILEEKVSGLRYDTRRPRRLSAAEMDRDYEWSDMRDR